MASVIPENLIPIEMWTTMIIQRYPDLADQLDEISMRGDLSVIEKEKEIHNALQIYEMYLANGRIKPKAMCS